MVFIECAHKINSCGAVLYCVLLLLLLLLFLLLLFLFSFSLFGFLKKMLRFFRRAVADCDNGHFGASCLEECHCAGDETCDPVTGECPSGCAQGYEGPTCSHKTPQ